MDLLSVLKERGMEQVLGPAQAAGPAAEAALLADLKSVDWNMLDRQRAALKKNPALPQGEIRPPELCPPSTGGSPEAAAAAEIGWQALRAGRVAVATVAGGQASRLGFHGPKGAYPLGPVSGASLFQVMAGQLRRLRALSGAAVPWIIQTGPGNHLETQAYFAARNWYGLGRHSVHFVCQGTLPALDPKGHFLLASPAALFRNPDGHGGFYRAIRNSGLGPQLRDQGIDLVYYCQVDNPLVRMGDPAFLGFHLNHGARMSVKVVEKTEPAEKVGMIIRREDGRLGCIEYSDLPEELATERAEDGGLRFRAGNIATHCFELGFLEEMAEASLPLHLARKEIPAWKAGKVVAVKGVKFETFVFDALPLADHAVVQLADRNEEFAPVKNRVGNDSIATSRAAWIARTRCWVDGLDGIPADTVDEIEAGLCYDAADLHRRSADLVLRAGGHLLASR